MTNLAYLVIFIADCIAKVKSDCLRDSRIIMHTDTLLQPFVGADLSALIGINLRKSSSNSVGARAERGGGEGLYGRPRPVPCAPMWRNAITPPAPGDHQSPLNIPPTFLPPPPPLPP